MEPLILGQGDVTPETFNLTLTVDHGILAVGNLAPLSTRLLRQLAKLVSDAADARDAAGEV